jgi:crotonobetainyl-CoA:carnitine CoA-transferase CaiB-like acyl-CoA transferase
MLNSNKESVVLDLKQPRGKEIFLALVAKADVVIENFAAGVMDRLGLGWESLRKINPRLVYGGSSGFGLDGPYRDLAAMDVTIQAMSGITNATGQTDRRPRRGPPSATFWPAFISAPAFWAHWCNGSAPARASVSRWRCTSPP